MIIKATIVKVLVDSEESLNLVLKELSALTMTQKMMNTKLTWKISVKLQVCYSTVKPDQSSGKKDLI
jgi:hypothetical protein